MYIFEKILSNHYRINTVENFPKLMLLFLYTLTQQQTEKKQINISSYQLRKYFFWIAILTIDLHSWRAIYYSLKLQSTIRNA